MHPALLLIIALFSYGRASIAQYRNNSTIFDGAIALLSHAYLLYLWIDVEQAHALTVPYLLSQLSWLLALAVWLVSLRWRQILGLVVYPLAALLLLFAATYKSQILFIGSLAEPLALLHILLALMLSACFLLTLAQTVLVFWQKKAIKQGQSFTKLNRLPPLDISERLLSYFLWFSFVLLSFLLLSSLGFALNQVELLALKFILSVVCWLCLALVLLSRYYYPLRGWLSFLGTLLALVSLIIIIVLS